MIEKININLLEGNKSCDTECEIQNIPYEDIELLAKKIGMDYFTEKALPPYGWKIGFYTHYLQQEVTNTIRLLGYTGEFNFIIII